MPQTLRINYTNLVLALLALAGVAQFLFCLQWSIDQYPGGYRWGKHFISDLGRTRTVAGEDNSVSSNLFAQTMAVLGLTLIPFMLALPELFTYGKLPLRVLGILSSIGLIAIGQTPYDLYADLHHLALGVWIVPMAAMVILLPIFLRIDSAAPDFLVVLSLILLSATVLYGIAGFHSGYVVMQKVVIFLSVLWLLVVAVCVSIAARRTLSARQQLLANQANQYAKRIA